MGDNRLRPVYPYRLRQMHIELVCEPEYYGEAYSELDNSEFRRGFIDYFEG